MTKFERLFPVFGAAFAVIYAVVLDYNWALFTYHPKLGIWDAGAAAPKDGPAMYWYGVVTAALGARDGHRAGGARPGQPDGARAVARCITWVVTVGCDRVRRLCTCCPTRRRRRDDFGKIRLPGGTSICPAVIVRAAACGS